MPTVKNFVEFLCKQLHTIHRHPFVLELIASSLPVLTVGLLHFLPCRSHIQTRMKIADCEANSQKPVKPGSQFRPLLSDGGLINDRAGNLCHSQDLWSRHPWSRVIVLHFTSFSPMSTTLKTGNTDLDTVGLLAYLEKRPPVHSSSIDTLFIRRTFCRYLHRR